MLESASSLKKRRCDFIDGDYRTSLRRSQIISDVFARLRLIERRGSDIGRILSGHAECDRQPEFFSNSDFIVVTMSNKGFDPKSKGLRGMSEVL